MASFDAVPVEIFDMICSEMSPPEQAALSRTSKVFHKLTIPNLYKSVTLTTDKASTAQCFIRGAEKHGEHVKSLHIVVPPAYCSWCECDDCSHEKSKPKWKSPAGAGRPALDILRGEYDFLNSIPHLTVEFPSHFPGHNPIWRDLERDATSVMDRDQNSQFDLWYGLECANARRSGAVFSQLSERGDKSNIVRLSLVNLQLCDVGDVVACEEEGFKAFLGSLERFDLKLWRGTSSIQLPARQYLQKKYYDKIYEELPYLFFHHLCKVKHIRFEASLHAPIGHIDDKYGSCRIPLVDEEALLEEEASLNTMPHLEKLELVNIMVDTPLLEFLETRAGKKPLALTLDGTFAYEQREDGNWNKKRSRDGKWAAVLGAITAMISREDGPRLKSFELTPRGPDGKFTAVAQSPSMPYDRGLPFRYAFLAFEEKCGRELGHGPWCWCAGTDLYDARRYGTDQERKGDCEAEEELMKAIAAFNGRR